jgi:CMP-N,N'-diacetyllegionaminic acid synthase
MSPLVLGVVPARGGSKGIPDKNLRPLAGRPLLAYVRDAAQVSGVVDRLVLSTDSEEIAELGRRLGLDVPFLRPAELARDDSPMQPVVEHAVVEVERGGWRPDVVLVLQPTAPLRRGEHIAAAVDLLERSGCSSVVSVVEIPRHFAPQYAMKMVEGRLVPYLPEGRRITRRQDAEAAYSRDGTVYAVRRDVLVEQHDLYGDDCRPLVLAADESVNLDAPGDWAAAEVRLSA